MFHNKIESRKDLLHPRPCVYSLLHYQHLSQECCICYNWWTNADTTLWFTFDVVHSVFGQILDWYKCNCSFCIVGICHLMLEYIFNKCDITHHFNAHFSLFFFANVFLLAVYLYFLDYGNNVRQKANLSYFLGSKVIKQWRQCATSSTHLA